MGGRKENAVVYKQRPAKEEEDDAIHGEHVRIAQEHAQEQGAGTGVGTMCTTVKDGVTICTKGGKAIAAGAALHALHVRRCTVPVEVYS